VQSEADPRLVGTVRGERIANRVVQTIARTAADHARAAGWGFTEAPPERSGL